MAKKRAVDKSGPSSPAARTAAAQEKKRNQAKMNADREANRAHQEKRKSSRYPQGKYPDVKPKSKGSVLGKSSDTSSSSSSSGSSGASGSKKTGSTKRTKAVAKIAASKGISRSEANALRKKRKASRSAPKTASKAKSTASASTKRTSTAKPKSTSSAKSKPKAKSTAKPKTTHYQRKVAKIASNISKRKTARGAQKRTSNEKVARAQHSENKAQARKMLNADKSWGAKRNKAAKKKK